MKAQAVKTPILSLNDHYREVYGEEDRLWLCGGFVRRVLGDLPLPPRVVVEVSKKRSFGATEVWLKRAEVASELVSWATPTDKVWWKYIYEAFAALLLKELNITRRPTKWWVTVKGI